MGLGGLVDRTFLKHTEGATTEVIAEPGEGRSAVGARFTRVQEDFTCLHCGMAVHGTGYTNHCPRCLWSRHVDVYPGDRAATCHALMEPVAALSEGDETIVVQRCTGCGHLWRNKVSPADDRDAVFALFGRAAPHPETPQPPTPPTKQPPKARPVARPGRGRAGGNSSRKGRGT